MMTKCEEESSLAIIDKLRAPAPALFVSYLVCGNSSEFSDNQSAVDAQLKLVLSEPDDGNTSSYFQECKYSFEEEQYIDLAKKSEACNFHAVR